MTQRESFELSELREQLFKECGYVCQNPECGKSIYHNGSPMLAHKIAQTLGNIKKYGKCVIHHPKNLAPVCCLKCNDAMNIGYNTGEAEKLADEIRDDLLKE